MAKVRLPLQVEQAQRAASSTVDPLVENAFVEATPSGLKYTTRRPGIISEISGTGTGLGIFEYDDTIYVWDDGTTWDTPITGTTAWTRFGVVRDYVDTVDGQYRYLQIAPSADNILTGAYIHIGDYPFSTGDMVTFWSSPVGPILTKTAYDTYRYQYYKNLTYSISGVGSLTSSFDPGIQFSSIIGVGSATTVLSSSSPQLFVIAGSTNQISKSSTGTSWSTQTISGTWYGLSWLNNKYFLVGDSSKIYYSTDGTSWTLATTIPAGNIRSVAYGGGVYVVVGQSSYIASSTDGITWTTRSSPTSSNYNSVTYGNGVFVAVGDSGKIITSTDGSSWSTATNPFHSTNNITSVATDGTNFVAVQGGGAAICYAAYSSNGTSWTDMSTGLGGALYGVTKGSGQWLISGNAGFVYTASSLGGSWSGANIGTGNNLRSIYYGNSLYITTGDLNTLYTSTNGSSWTSRTSGFSGGTTINAATYG